MHGYNWNPSVNATGLIQQDDLQNFKYNYDQSRFWDQNNSLMHWKPNEKSLYENRAGNAAVYLTSSHMEQASSTLPSSSGTFNQHKAYESSTTMGTFQIIDYPQCIPRYEQGESVSSVRQSSNTDGLASKASWLVESSQKSIVWPIVSSGLVDQKAFPPKNNTLESACKLQQGNDAKRQLNNPFFSVVGQVSAGESVSVDNLQAGGGYISSVTESNYGDRNGDPPTRNISRHSTAASLCQPLKRESSPESFPGTKGHGSKDEVSQKYGKLDDNAASMVEKLWDGYLQLNSSVKLSTAAYFRSGEKMPDISWSQSVEVKGKVRLEAFQKYIQELPRSRNRGLTVMSLRLKEVSSCKSGRVGIKEVANKLIEGERVGFAQLSPGVDLYVCPHSGPIVSLLERHGFSRNMAMTAKDEHDSLIGCLVWRRTSDQNMKREDEKNDAISNRLSSPSLSNNELKFSASSSSSSAKLRGEAIQITGSVGSESKENMEIPSCKIIAASCSSSSCIPPGVSSSMISPALSEKLPFPCGDLNPIHDIVKQLSDIQASIFRTLGVENDPGNLELLKAFLPPSNPTKTQPSPVPNSEDDDLPEYDFSSVAAIAPSSGPLIEPKEAANKKLPGKELEQCNESHRWNQICVESQKALAIGRLPFPQKRKAQELEFECSGYQVAGNSHSKSKNLFTDDDMPEWNPSDREPLKSSLAQSSRPSSNTFRVLHPNSTDPPPSSTLPPLTPKLLPSDPRQFPEKQWSHGSAYPMGHNRGMVRSLQLPLPPRAHGGACVQGSPGSIHSIKGEWVENHDTQLYDNVGDLSINKMKKRLSGEFITDKWA